jgi:hypothetical protein
MARLAKKDEKNGKKEEETALAVAGFDEAAVAQWAKEAVGDDRGAGLWLTVRSGQLAVGGQAVKGNAIDVMVIDAAYENTFYKGKFDPDAREVPTCYAVARMSEGMVPADNVKERQHPTCTGCPQNVFGSAETGKGKACQNRRRLAVIAADDGLNAKTIARTDLAYFKLPVTSGKGWQAYAKNLIKGEKRMPQGVVTRISVVPDEKTQFQVKFQMVHAVEDKMLNAALERRAAEGDNILFKYPDKADAPTKPAKDGKRKGGKF